MPIGPRLLKPEVPIPMGEPAPENVKVVERIVYVERAAAPAPSEGKGGGIAALLSLVIPGAGQMYKGQVVGGLLWLVFVIVGYFAMVVPGIVLHLICIASAASKK